MILFDLLSTRASPKGQVSRVSEWQVVNFLAIMLKLLNVPTFRAIVLTLQGLLDCPLDDCFVILNI